MSRADSVQLCIAMIKTSRSLLDFMLCDRHMFFGGDFDLPIKAVLNADNGFNSIFCFLS